MMWITHKKRTPDHNNALLMKTSPIDAADNHYNYDNDDNNDKNMKIMKC